MKNVLTNAIHDDIIVKAIPHKDSAADALSDFLRSEPKANAERFRELMQSSGAKPQGGLCAVLP